MTIILHNKKIVEYININKIHNDLWDARINPEDEKFMFLKQSIETDGLYNPITITPSSSPHKSEFSIVDGRRRFEVMKQLNYKEIECFIVEGKNEGEIAAITLIQNLHRKNLSDIERCKGIAEIFEKIGYSLDDAITNCKRIHNKDIENIDPKFIKMVKTIGYSANFTYQLMQLHRDLPLSTFKYAEKKGLATDQKILLTHSKLKQHKQIQKDLIDDLAKTKDIKESRIAVYQVIRDLETGALFKSGKGYVVHTFLRDRVDEHNKLEYTPYKSYFEIMKHSIELLKGLTGHQITQGEYEYTKDHVNRSAQHRIDMMKTLNSRTIVALIEQLRMVQYAIDSMESVMAGEERETSLE